MPKVTITVPDQTPQPYRFQLEREVVGMGRGEDNDIVIDSGSVSVLHAEMHRIPGGYELRDLGSTNGITLNGERMDVVSLRTGGDVKLGEVTFDFALTGNEIEILRNELSAPVAPMLSSEPLGLPAMQAAEPSILPKPKPVEPREYATASSGGGSGKLVLLVIFMLVAFGVGLGVRYQKETGGSLVDAVRAKYAPAAPAGK